VVIVGGGWIGLEVASASRHAGAEVTLVETQSQPLLSVLGPQIAQVFADLHREHGVDLRLDAKIASIEGAGGDVDGAVVHLEDGSEITGDLLVVGIGAAPDTALAEAAGLAVDNGVLVDASLRTSHPDVYAVGDVANHDHSTLGRLRVEHWDNAIEQAKVAAHNLAGSAEAGSDSDETYDRQPYFFTDQYDLGMEYVGHTSPGEPTDVVTRGDLAGRVFQAFWVKDGLVKAAMQVNDWDASDAIKAIVGKTVDVDKLADDNIPLGDLG
jgi:3-phenylpropionate/trans-cinnamate dioxygenase ferredoxin reductase subunit